MNNIYGSYSNNMINNLMQRKSLIEQEIQALQNPQPNFTPTYAMPQNTTSFDFNGKYVNNYEDAVKEIEGNKQLIIMNRNEPLFYMKGADNKVHTYEFSETKQINEVDELKNKLNEQSKIIEQLQLKLGGTNNEPTISTNGKPIEPKQY